MWNINFEKVERRKQKVDNFGRLLHLSVSSYIFTSSANIFLFTLRKISSDSRNIFSRYRDERGGGGGGEGWEKARKQIAWYERIITPKLSHERNNRLQELSHNEYNALRKVWYAHTWEKKLQKNTTFSLIRSVRRRYQILLIINRRQWDVIASSL